MNRNWLWSCLVLLLIAPMGYAEEEGDEQATDSAPEDCVSVRHIKKTDVIDDQNILFRMNGGKIYRNHLPRKCFGLKRSDGFSYEIRTPRLCDLDSVKVLDQFGGGIRPGPSCGLGKFHSITEEEAAFLMGDEPRAKPPEAPDEDE
jgi:hypothetical protein